jgi:hypothetical protein
MRITIIDYSLLALFLSAVLCGCSETPSRLVMPASNITVSGISLVNVTKTMSEFITPDSSLQQKNDGTYSYSTAQTLDPIAAGNNLSIDPISSLQKIEVGQFTVPGIDPVSLSISLNDLGLISGTYPFPIQTSVTLPENAMTISSQMNYVFISEGSLTLTIKNKLPMKLGFNVPIVIRNNQGGNHSVIAQFTMPVIGEDSSASQTVSLNNAMLSANILIDAINCSVDAQTIPFTIDASDGIEFQITSTALTVDSASAVIPEQSVVAIHDSVIVLDTTIVIQEAICKSGNLSMVFKNNTSVSVFVQGKILELQNCTTNESFTIAETIAKQDSLVIPLSLDQWKIISTQHTTGTTATFSVSVKTMGSHGAMETLSRYDNVYAEVRTNQSIALRSIKGKIAPRIVTVQSSVKSNLDLHSTGQLSGTINLKGMTLQIHLLSTGIRCPIDYHLALIAKTSTKNRQDSIVFGTDNGMPRLYFDPAINNGCATIALSDVKNFDTFLTQCFPDLPDTFSVQGYFVFNPQDEYLKADNSCLITDTSKVFPSIDLEIPLSGSITNGSVTEMIGLPSDAKIPDNVTESVGEGTVTLSMTNRIPLQMNISLSFLGNYSSNSTGDTLLVINPVTTIQAANVDATGSAVTPAYTKFSVTLNGAQMTAMNKSDSVCVKISNLAVTPGSTVKFNSSDYIKIYATGSFLYTMSVE